MSLTAEKQQAYRANGFIFPLDVLSTDEAAQHNDALAAVEKQHGPMHYRVKPYLVSTSAWAIATHAGLLDAVESVLGPDILLWDSSYIVKEPHSNKFVSWHQDLTYWGLRMASDDDLVSAWLALTPATKNNGAMQFVRGSHKRGRYQHEDTYDAQNLLHRGQSIVNDFENTSIAQMELAPGQASLHHGWTVHSSGPNATATRRVGIVMNYLKPSVCQVVADYETATLVRGEDRYGHFGPEPVCQSDFDPANVEFQLQMERKKREVYDTA
ncbi:MAG: phytanoyl-CoA dioxygenase family protein [Gammaproteobacteria bacterium]|nr:phytanoyl-CoA dioxygenase family protein [Gammaproteobacteria bacterium]